MSVMGDRIRQLRKSQGVKQTELADAIGVTFTVISNIERGYSAPKPFMVERIAEFFNVPTDYIMGRTNTRFRGMRPISVVSERLSALMKQEGVSPEDLSEESGMELQAINAILAGDMQPSMPDLAVVASTLRTTVDYLIGYSEYQTGVCNEDESDIVEYYRQMDKYQRRLLMAELEKILRLKEVD